ncbi:hypothetical protein AB0I60_06300 [Actinosynnema sp. NPDC050436]|uniref:hypothetical protein n=1 Tax=Actinosynnema sp. NPDC050436 TaxID=3155659 RepID=UPI0033DDB8C8
MELSLSGRLGGPDRSPVESLVLRRALRPALARVVVDGLAVLDVSLTLGGSITSGEGHGGVHDLRYSAARERITVNVVVPASELAREPVAVAVGPHFEALARRIAARCAQDREDELVAAFADALRQAAEDLSG